MVSMYSVSICRNINKDRCNILHKFPMYPVNDDFIILFNVTIYLNCAIKGHRKGKIMLIYQCPFSGYNKLGIASQIQTYSLNLDLFYIQLGAEKLTFALATKNPGRNHTFAGDVANVS